MMQICKDTVHHWWQLSYIHVHIHTYPCTYTVWLHTCIWCGMLHIQTFVPDLFNWGIVVVGELWHHFGGLRLALYAELTMKPGFLWRHSAGRRSLHAYIFMFHFPAKMLSWQLLVRTSYCEYGGDRVKPFAEGLSGDLYDTSCGLHHDTCQSRVYLAREHNKHTVLAGNHRRTAYEPQAHGPWGECEVLCPPGGDRLRAGQPEVGWRVPGAFWPGPARPAASIQVECPCHGGGKCPEVPGLTLAWLTRHPWASASSWHSVFQHKNPYTILTQLKPAFNIFTEVYDLKLIVSSLKQQKYHMWDPAPTLIGSQPLVTPAQ